MKKFIPFLLVSFLFPLYSAHTQLAVLDAGANTLLAKSGMDQVVHYTQQAKEWLETAERFKQQLEHWKFQVERTLQTLKSAQDIKSYDDFMSWYNRQLYQERQTMDMFKNANISIGNKNYSLYDLEGIVDAVDDKYVKYWNEEFTDKQRKEMWLNLGLTPSNYAFVQPFRQKARELSREAFFASDIQNEWYVRNMERNNERQQKLAADKFLSDLDQMGDKEVLQLLLESSMENNKVLNDLAMMQAKQLEMQASQYYLDQAEADAPRLSDWPEDGFRPLKSSKKSK
jgi:hypothetical protein